MVFSYDTPQPVAMWMKNTLNNAMGIWLMLAGFATFSVVDLIAKLLTADFHPVQIAWTRQLGASLVMVYLALFTARTIFVTTAFRLQVIRGLCAVTSATLFIVGISYVPLADPVIVGGIVIDPTEVQLIEKSAVATPFDNLKRRIAISNLKIPVEQQIICRCVLREKLCPF